MSQPKHILIVGANGLVGRDFQEKFSDKYIFSLFTKENIIRDLPENIHAAIFTAQSADYKQPQFTSDLLDVNVKLVHEILSFYADKAPKIIYFSSGSVYKNNGSPLTEASPLNSMSGNPYVASKIMAEELVQTFKTQFKTLITLRPFFIYGRHQSSQMLMKTMFTRVNNGEKISLSGQKGLIFNPVYVEDMSLLLDHLLCSNEIIGTQVYNVAGPETTDLCHTVKFMSEICGKPLNMEITGDNDSTLLAEVNIPNWKPKYGIKEGLTKTFGS